MIEPRPRTTARILSGLVAGLVLSAGAALGMPPGEVSNVALDGAGNLGWSAVPQAEDYNVYRGLLSGLTAGIPARCHGDEIAATAFSSPADPPPGDGYFYLVTAESAQGEGTPGTETGGATRTLLGTCDAVMRNHVLDRLGYGWNEWSRDRLTSLGTAAYISEQLDPLSIDESDNTDLNSRRDPITPPVRIRLLYGHTILNGVYGRRQLADQYTVFWANHFTTEHLKIRGFFYRPNFYTYEDVSRLTSDVQFREMEAFRQLGFDGNFREMLGASVLSPAMIIYLDTRDNLAGNPNENHAREILELHGMGVDGGYTQQDVEELSRVLTGWTVCKKQWGFETDPLAACLVPPNEYTVSGQYVRHFRANFHDCEQKVLFQGTPHEAVIPDTCDGGGLPTVNGVDDIELALDAIASHPSTARFISRKILQKFLTDAPSEAMVDDVVAEWNDAAHPYGVGDMREVLRAVVTHPEFLNPDRARSKIKTPVEHVISAFRAIRGYTDGNIVVYDYTVRMSHRPHENPSPDGYPETGADWLGTNNVLERQNYGLDLTPRTGTLFAGRIPELMAAAGLTAASPPADIVDFWADILFGGALTPAEKQAAIDYLTTDDNGAPAAVTDAKVRETVGFMMGMPQFLEQ
jgi:uncharacterized protein (DUF1800 family)